MCVRSYSDQADSSGVDTTAPRELGVLRLVSNEDKMAITFARLVWIVMSMVLVSPLADVVTSSDLSSVAMVRTHRPLVLQRTKMSDSVPTDIELPMALPPISTDSDFFRAIITAYSSSPDETDDTPFITASGRRVFDGLIACPRRYPFGTRFKIGGRDYTCWDRLHYRFDDRFDIWMATKNQALQFGLRKLIVEVLG